jgi:hypothetical protein
MKKKRDAISEDVLSIIYGTGESYWRGGGGGLLNRPPSCLGGGGSAQPSTSRIRSRKIGKLTRVYIESTSIQGRIYRIGSPPPPGGDEEGSRMSALSMKNGKILVACCFRLLSCPFCLNSSILHLIYPFTSHFLFFLFLSPFFLILLHYIPFSLPFIFPPKCHRLISPSGGGGGHFLVYRPLSLGALHC